MGNRRDTLDPGRYTRASSLGAWLAFGLAAVLAVIFWWPASDPRELGATTPPNASGPDGSVTTTAPPLATSSSIAKTTEPTEAPDPNCVESGDQDAINRLLTKPRDVAVLCRGAVFELTGPIVYTARGQMVYTDTLPTDGSRAVLKLVSRAETNAVLMRDVSEATLSNVTIDGNRHSLGPMRGDALVLAGGSATRQVIRQVRALDPRSWSTIHVFEGDSPQCSDATVEQNEVGPAGHPDGTWADGISLACRSSIVRDNVIWGATDGGIVVFGAPGSLIMGNTVRAVDHVLLGGINMVDYHPFDGDFTGTIVRDNVIDSSDGVIKVGLAMGHHVWFCGQPEDAPTDARLVGGTVTGNTLRGQNMQYGFAIDGVQAWTVTGNVDLASHSGTPTEPCLGTIADEPDGFLYNPERSEGSFQSEFKRADLDRAVMAIVVEPNP